ncbi:MAG: hypothetical protein J6Q24_02720, partial [Clostridia bacterium]|nr:hypothetical protein [Clostridia bacterium]
SFLRHPVPLLFLICEGIVTGINIKLLMYQQGFFSSFTFAFITACLILLDVFIFSFCFLYIYPTNRSAFSIMRNASVYIFYSALSLLFSYLITLLF